MICEKCGREFADDMPKCIWCDHVPSVRPEPEIEEKESADEIELDAEGNLVPHPAKNFMWSVSLGGPIIAWLFHRKELKKSRCSFFWYLFAYNCCFACADRVLGLAFKHVHSGIAVLLAAVAWMILWFVVIGRLGAKRMKLALPHYNTERYKKREHWAVAVGAVLYTMMFAVSFARGFVESLPSN